MTALAAPPAPPGADAPRVPRRLAGVEGVRALAALGVVATHCAGLAGIAGSGVLGQLTDRLNAGVALFFLLSGFLLHRPYVRARLDGRPAPGLGGYALRRAVRILPAYWVALGVLALLVPAAVRGVVGPDGWRTWLLLSPYELRTALDGLLVAWSLSTEVAFYVALPLVALGIARLVARRPREQQVALELALLAGSIPLAFAARWLARDLGASRLLDNWLVGRWPWFAAGMLLAVLHVGGGPLAARLRALAAGGRGWAWWAVAVGVLALSAYGGLLNPSIFITPAQTDLELLLFLVLGLAVLVPVVFGGAEGLTPTRALDGPVMTWLGTVSYGVFLWHYPIATWAYGDALPGRPWLALGLTLVLTLLAAALSWYAVERPLLRWAARRR